MSLVLPLWTWCGLVLILHGQVRLRPTYQRFIVPTPLPGQNKTRVGYFLCISYFLLAGIRACGHGHHHGYQRGGVLVHESALHYTVQQVEGVFRVQFYLQMTWLDPRLRFKGSAACEDDPVLFRFQLKFSEPEE